MVFPVGACITFSGSWRHESERPALARVLTRPLSTKCYAPAGTGADFGWNNFHFGMDDKQLAARGFIRL